MAIPILVDAARLLVNLGSLGSGFTGEHGFEDPTKFSGEYLAASVTSMSADGLAGGAALAKLGGLDGLTRIRFEGGSTKVKSPPGSKQELKSAGSLILWALTIVEVLELTTGFGPPTEGDDLKTGAQQFSTLCAQLKSALPDDSWQGSASEAYAGLDTALQSSAQTMAELDLRLAALVEDQAEWVTHMRLGFGILKDVLFACYVVELIIRFAAPPLGPAVSQAFAITVSALGITTALGFLTTLTTYSVLNGKKADALAGQYSALASGTVQKGSLAEAEVATTGQSTVSSFEAISAGMSGTSALSATPAVAPPVREAEGSGDERAPLSAQMNASETPGGGMPEAPQTPDKAMPSAPAVTMPTLAQVSAMSGQPSKPTGQLSQHANLVNQAMGQIQQLAQTGQQGQGTAASARQAATEETSLAGVEGAEAASGTHSAERAPVDVTASGGQETPGPGRAQRTT